MKGREKELKLLVADDDPVTREIIERLLTKWGYDVSLACDGNEAYQILEAEDGPKLAVLDWVMPEMYGPEVCRRIRKLKRSEPVYLILLTAKGLKEDVVEGLEAGANDYITKPFDSEELRARVQVGRQMAELQSLMAARVRQLEEAMAHIKTLQGFIPICSYCKKIRDDKNYWQQIESYLADHADIQFSHGICPDCYEKYVVPEIKSLQKYDREVRGKG